VTAPVHPRSHCHSHHRLWSTATATLPATATHSQPRSRHATPERLPAGAQCTPTPPIHPHHPSPPISHGGLGLSAPSCAADAARNVRCAKLSTVCAARAVAAAAPNSRSHRPRHHAAGFTAFRGVQEAAVRAALAGQDAFVLMPTGEACVLLPWHLPCPECPHCIAVLLPTRHPPTHAGGGKSLCFALPAAVTQGLVLVVSPLIGACLSGAHRTWPCTLHHTPCVCTS
jgi:hypothetical protein